MTARVEFILALWTTLSSQVFRFRVIRKKLKPQNAQYDKIGKMKDFGINWPFKHLKNRFCYLFVTLRCIRDCIRYNVSFQYACGSRCGACDDGKTRCESKFWAFLWYFSSYLWLNHIYHRFNYLSSTIWYIWDYIGYHKSFQCPFKFCYGAYNDVKTRHGSKFYASSWYFSSYKCGLNT